MKVRILHTTSYEMELRNEDTGEVFELSWAELERLINIGAVKKCSSFIRGRTFTIRTGTASKFWRVQNPNRE